MNPFESGERKLIPAVLVYGRRGDEVLFLHRTPSLPANQGSVHSDKWNGLGGKLEIGESFAEAAKREFREESGLDLPIDAFRALGFLHFPGFQAHKNQDWVVRVFEALLPSGELKGLLSGCAEGELRFVKEKDVLSLNLWEGDPHFLPLVLARTPFEGTFWYRELRLERFELRPLGD